MSKSLSRRGMLQAGGCASFAAGALSMVAPALAQETDVAALWRTYEAVRSEGDRLHGLWSEACDRAEARTPVLPDGLAFPNPLFSPWLQSQNGTIWAVRRGKGLHYRPEVLAEFINDPPEIRSSLDAERVPRICALIRDLLPKAEAYMSAVEDAWREADEIERACCFDELADRQCTAAAALMDARVAVASDFGFKARLIRLRLDDDLNVETEARKLADQIIAFWPSAANLEVSNSIL